jgi:hypothetical protein
MCAYHPEHHCCHCCAMSKHRNINNEIHGRIIHIRMSYWVNPMVRLTHVPKLCIWATESEVCCMKEPSRSTHGLVWDTLPCGWGNEQTDCALLDCEKFVCVHYAVSIAVWAAIQSCKLIRPFSGRGVNSKQYLSTLHNTFLPQLVVGSLQ